MGIQLAPIDPELLGQLLNAFFQMFIHFMSNSFPTASGSLGSI